MARVPPRKDIPPPKDTLTHPPKPVAIALVLVIGYFVFQALFTPSVKAGVAPSTVPGAYFATVQNTTGDPVTATCTVISGSGIDTFSLNIEPNATGFHSGSVVRPGADYSISCTHF